MGLKLAVVVCLLILSDISGAADSGWLSSTTGPLTFGTGRVPWTNSCGCGNINVQSETPFRVTLGAGQKSAYLCVSTSDYQLQGVYVTGTAIRASWQASAPDFIPDSFSFWFVNGSRVSSDGILTPFVRPELSVAAYGYSQFPSDLTTTQLYNIPVWSQSVFDSHIACIATENNGTSSGYVDIDVLQYRVYTEDCTSQTGCATNLVNEECLDVSVLGCASASSGYYVEGKRAYACSVANCDTCPGDSCTMCTSGRILTADGSACPTSCPAGSYQDGSESQCTACTAHCNACDSSGCSDCATGYIAVNDQSSCVTSCPAGFFGEVNVDNICQACSDVNCALCEDDECSLCKSGYILSMQGTCVEECPSGEQGTADVNEQCSCIDVPPYIASVDGVCGPECPEGEYGEPGVDEYCTNCIDPLCALCEGTTCIRCKLGRILNSASVCVTSCPLDFFGDVDEDVQCCDSQTQIRARNGACVSECPAGQIGVVGTDEDCIVDPGTTGSTTTGTSSSTTESASEAGTTGTTGTNDEQDAIGGSVETGEDEDEGDNGVIFAVIAVLFCLVCLVLGVVGFLFHKSHKEDGRQKRMKHRFDATDASDATVKMEDGGVSLSEQVEELINQKCTDVIGKGGSAVVYKTKTQQGEWIALKQLIRPDQANIEAFHAEVNIMSRFQADEHDNVVAMSFFVTEPTYALAMEYCSKGTLFDYVQKNSRLRDSAKISLLRGTAEGMKYIHSKGVAHLDLKTKNVLLTADLVPKLSDFGISRIVDQPAPQGRAIECTPHYAPPDFVAGLVEHGPALFKVDSYCFAHVVAAVWTGEEPGAGMTSEAMVSQHSNSSTMPTIPVTVPNEVAAIMGKCWQIAAEVRPTFDEICVAIDSANLASVGSLPSMRSQKSSAGLESQNLASFQSEEGGAPVLASDR